MKRGDLLFFPPGYPHSIQGLGPDGCEFLLAFDDGHFSEDSTLLITDWIAHTPRAMLAASLGVDPSLFDHAPKQELYIFPASGAGSTRRRTWCRATVPVVPEPFNFAMLDRKPDVSRCPGGTVRIIDSSTFKASRDDRGRARRTQSRWHPGAALASERGRVAVLSERHQADDRIRRRWQSAYGRTSPQATSAMSSGRTGTASRIPAPTSSAFLEIFASDHYAEITLADWIANTPRELVAAHLNVDPDVLASHCRSRPAP